MGRRTKSILKKKRGKEEDNCWGARKRGVSLRKTALIVLFKLAGEKKTSPGGEGTLCQLRGSGKKVHSLTGPEEENSRPRRQAGINSLSREGKGKSLGDPEETRNLPCGTSEGRNQSIDPTPVTVKQRLRKMQLSGKDKGRKEKDPSSQSKAETTQNERYHYVGLGGCGHHGVGILSDLI